MDFMYNKIIKSGFWMTAWGTLIPAVFAVLLVMVSMSKVMTQAVADPALAVDSIVREMSGWFVAAQVLALACNLLVGYGLIRAARASAIAEFSVPIHSLGTMFLIYTGLTLLMGVAQMTLPASKLGMAVKGALTVFTFGFYIAYLFRGKRNCAMAAEASRLQGLQICSKGFGKMAVGSIVIIILLMLMGVVGTALQSPVALMIFSVAMMTTGVIMLVGFIQTIIGWFKAAMGITMPD